ncbi:procathepsin L-like isoform X2 [Lutra lutra]|nr:procathepsin L-like isoform X2 [Lutra lutra]
MNAVGDLVRAAGVPEPFVLSLFGTLPKNSHPCQHSAFFSLKTSEEFRDVMNDLKIQKDTDGQVFEIPFFADLIVPVDRRQTAGGQCASGWAFREASALEGHRFQKTGQILSLSEWNLLDSSWSQGSEGCHGGLMNYAFQHVPNNRGLDSEESYPYRPGDGPCAHRPSVLLPAPLAGERASQEESLVLVVAAVGPFSAALRASLDNFRFYKEG